MQQKLYLPRRHCYLAPSSHPDFWQTRLNTWIIWYLPPKSMLQDDVLCQKNNMVFDHVQCSIPTQTYGTPAIQNILQQLMYIYKCIYMCVCCNKLVLPIIMLSSPRSIHYRVVFRGRTRRRHPPTSKVHPAQRKMRSHSPWPERGRQGWPGEPFRSLHVQWGKVEPTRYTMVPQFVS